jgi:hypothetical protein
VGDERRRTTAYHEAGHAVACVRLGGDLFGWTTIQPEGHRLGAVSHSGFPERIGKDGVLKPWSMKCEAVMCYAGRAAEAVLRGESFAVAFPETIAYSDGDEQDRDLAEKGLASIGDVTTLAPRYQRFALWLMRRYWKDVQLVARALLDYEELTPDEVWILLDRNGGRQAMVEFRSRFLKKS